MIFNYFIPKDSYKEIEFQSDNNDAEFMNNFQEMINLTAKNFFDNMKIVNESGLNINQNSNRPKSAFKTIAHQSSSSSLSLTDSSDRKEIKKHVIRKPLKKYDRQRSKSLIPARTTPIPKLIKYKFSIDSSQSIESNTWSTLTKSILSLTLSNRSLLNKDRLPCSNSLIDLCILLFRYQNTCEQLLDLCMPLIYVKIQKNLFQSRFNSFNNMFQEMYQFIEIYANNILSLEVCALDKSYLGNIFGNEIKKEILSGKLDGTIWGCRHRLKNSKYNCTYFIDKNSKYISDKYEPINEEMCIRVNNVLQLKEIRNTIYLSYNQNIQKYYNYLLKMNDRQSFNLFQQFKLEVYKIKLFNRNIELKIESITNGLICLLVHRFNLFCKKAIFLLISDELDSYPVITRMKPLIDFLNCNLNMLRDKLYAKLFLKFIRNLWNAFYENFVELIKKFENESAKNPQKEAITYRKMIDILMLKFKEYTTNHGFLESKMKQLCMMLNLYSQNTNNLIFLHYKLFNFNYQKHGSSDMDPKTSNSNYFQFDLIHLVKMTKKLKKNFSGKSFINFLKKFPPELNQIGIFSKDYCINYAQRLLEANYLRSVQARKKFLRRSSNKTQNLLEFDPIEYEALAEFDYANLNESKYDQESDALFNQCVENEIMDHDFITRILWHRIYDEPIVMKFISMRQSNFANNQYLNKILQRNTSNNSFDLNYPILHLV
ncbi:unnamed protein product [Brachionus calyciflorus]|uniref:MHD2 domain-containing protein n=1 Tax=Brachionus calyciflorus TaxID=104777 RepID=A0A814I8W7_9BILA|nr:unnamed protein product [Brachionus calyciflorus]